MFIRIDKFGPIKELDLEVKQFNLFIGEQGVGKSTLCKVIYFFRILEDNIVNYLYKIALEGEREQSFPSIMNRYNKDIFVSLFGYSWDLPNDIKLYCLYNDKSRIDISLSDGHYVDIKYNTHITNEIKKLERQVLIYFEKQKEKEKETLDNFIINENNIFREEIIREVSNLFANNMPTYYIPAGRNMLSLMTGQKTKLNYDAIDFVNLQFMQIIEMYAKYFSKGVSQAHNHFLNGSKNRIVDKIITEMIDNMKGEYFYESGMEYLKIENEKIPINFVSSGQQEILWLFNLLYIWMLNKKKVFVIIEEPEAHIYPKLQKEILEFIVQFMNFTQSNVLITTHSPYILTSTDLLLYGGKLKDKNVAVEDILGQDKYLYSDRSNIIKLSVCETRTNIENLQYMEKDIFEVIKVEQIDQVSTIINTQYTQLLSLEKSINE